MQKGFSAANIKSLYPFFEFHARHLRDRLLERIDSEETGKGVVTDMYRPLHRTTLDVLGHAAFGHSFQALDEPGLIGQVSYDENAKPPTSTNSLSRAFDDLLRVAVQSNKSWYNLLWDVSVMFFPCLLYLPIGLEANKDKQRARKVMDEEARKVIKRAEQDQKSSSDEYQRNDIIASLLRANANSRESGEGEKERLASGRLTLSSKAMLSDEELLAQITSLQLAGHESTGAQLAWLVYLLATNQDVQTKLRQEIREKRDSLGLKAVSSAWSGGKAGQEGRGEEGEEGKIEKGEEGKKEEEEEEHDEQGRELSMEEADSLQYLDWCIQEVCRLCPAVHTTSRSVIKDDVIPVDPLRSPSAPPQGIKVSPGLIIMIPIEALNRDPVLWGQDAEKFRPERWGEDDMPGKKQFNRVGGLTFLMGPRSCIANRFAVAEMKAIAILLCNSIHFEHAGHTIKPQRWLTSRPFDCTVGTEQCTLKLRRAHV